MADWFDDCAAAWVDATLAAALVMALAAVAMIQCRQPARRRVWGRLGLCASLLVVPLTLLNPLPRVHVRHPSHWIWASGPGPLPARSSPMPASGGAGPGSTDPADDGRNPWTTGRILLVGYGIGLVPALGRFALGLIGVGYLIRRAGAATDRAEALLEALPYSAPPSTRPRLGLSDRVHRPVLVGTRRPTILIPPAMDRPGFEDQLRLGLIHELAHAEMADHRFGPVAALAQAVWYFLPQAWWIRNQLRLDAEFLADHRAVGHFGTSVGYASSLFRLAGGSPTGDPVRPPTPPAGTPPEAGSAARRAGGLASALMQRMQMLLKCPFDVEDRAPQGWSLGVAAAVAAATLAASSLTAREARPAEGDPPPPRSIHVVDLVIAPQLLEDRPFDFLHLPDQFRLSCEVHVAPEELHELEMLGYRLGPRPGAASGAPGPGVAGWRRILIVRDAEGLESVRVDGREVVRPHRPDRAAAWLTIRPIPGRETRLRDLHLTW